MDEKRIDAVMACVRRELIRATEKHGPMRSGHEGYGIMAEEFAELLDELRANNRDNAVLEAIQIAAMGARFALDLSPWTD